jgi:hypothetical protein
LVTVGGLGLCGACHTELLEDTELGICADCWEEMADEQMCTLSMPTSTHMSWMMKRVRGRLKPKTKNVRLPLGPVTLDTLHSMRKYLLNLNEDVQILPIKMVSGQRSATVKRWEMTIEDLISVDVVFAPAFMGRGEDHLTAGAGKLFADIFATYIPPVRFVVTASNRRGTKDAEGVLYLRAASFSEYGPNWCERKPPVGEKVSELTASMARKVLRINQARMLANKGIAALQAQRTLLAIPHVAELPTASSLLTMALVKRALQEAGITQPAAASIAPLSAPAAGTAPAPEPG